MREDLIEALGAIADGMRDAGEHEDAAILDRAAAALEAAREDGERLDWMDTVRGDDVQGSYPNEPELVGHYWTVLGQCTDVRTAIDQARGKGVADEA